MLGSLFGKKKNTAPAVVERLSPAVSSSIFTAVGTRSIPSMPGPAHKAFQLTTDPSAEARDFIEVIEADEALSARVLRIANSVYYDRGKKSSTIEECVIVIGIEELKNLLNASTLSDIFPSRHPARAQLWANDIATALTARAIAQRTGAKASLAFLGGLMHDIGKLYLLQRSDDYPKVLKAVENEAIDFCAAESRIFPFDHTEVGQLIGEQWKFSDEIIDMIRNHHQPLPEAPAALTLPAVVQVADHVAHGLGLGHATTMNRFRKKKEEELDRVLNLLPLNSGQLKGFLQDVRRTFELEYDLYSGNFAR